MVPVTRIVFLVRTHAIEIGKAFLPLIENILFVSINFTLWKVFVRYVRPNERPKIKIFSTIFQCNIGCFCRYRSKDYVKQKKQKTENKTTQIKTNPK